VLHKDYNLKDFCKKEIFGREPEGDWRQDELIDGKPPVNLILTVFKGLMNDY
jgi:hypothetical protein